MYSKGAKKLGGPPSTKKSLKFSPFLPKKFGKGSPKIFENFLKDNFQNVRLGVRIGGVLKIPKVLLFRKRVGWIFVDF
jgi:hypothetical protein